MKARATQARSPQIAPKTPRLKTWGFFFGTVTAVTVEIIFTKVLANIFHLD